MLGENRSFVSDEKRQIWFGHSLRLTDDIDTLRISYILQIIEFTKRWKMRIFIRKMMTKVYFKNIFLKKIKTSQTTCSIQKAGRQAHWQWWRRHFAGRRVRDLTQQFQQIRQQNRMWRWKEGEEVSGWLKLNKIIEF